MASHTTQSKRVIKENNRQIKQDRSGKSNRSIIAFVSKMLNDVGSKYDLLKEEVGKLFKIIRCTDLQLQELQEENRQLKIRLRQLQYGSQVSRSLANDWKQASVLESLSQHKLSNIQTNQCQQNEQVSLLDGLQQPQALQELDNKLQKYKLNLDLSTIKKMKIQKEEQMTKWKGKRQRNIDNKGNNFHELDQIKSQIYSQYRNSFQMQLLQGIKSQLIIFKQLFENIHGIDQNEYVINKEDTYSLQTKFIFTHLQIESSSKIKQHLTNQNDMLRQVNTRYKNQLKKTQEELANIKNLLMNGFYNEYQLEQEESDNDVNIIG